MLVIILVILLVAYLTILERKVMSAFQRRVGPNAVGYRGLLQPFADGVKLLFKEPVFPLDANLLLFVGAPMLLFYLALLNWIFIPVDFGLSITHISYGLLVIIAINEVSVFGVIFSGWSANSKYPLIGSLRSTAQLISYSISMSLVFLAILLCIGTVDLLEILLVQIPVNLWMPLLPLVVLLYICIVAETNRAPFDLPEAESELVAGFMTEHAAAEFVMFFLGEYTNMVTLCTLWTVFFFGNLNIVLSSIVIIGCLSFMIAIRAAYPRLRIDHLFYLGWFGLLPLSLAFLVLFPSLMFTFDLLS